MDTAHDSFEIDTEDRKQDVRELETGPDRAASAPRLVVSKASQPQEASHRRRIERPCYDGYQSASSSPTLRMQYYLTTRDSSLTQVHAFKDPLASHQGKNAPADEGVLRRNLSHSSLKGRAKSPDVAGLGPPPNQPLPPLPAGVAAGQNNIQKKSCHDGNTLPVGATLSQGSHTKNSTEAPSPARLPLQNHVGISESERTVNPIRVSSLNAQHTSIKNVSAKAKPQVEDCTASSAHRTSSTSQTALRDRLGRTRPLTSSCTSLRYEYAGGRALTKQHSSPSSLLQALDESMASAGVPLPKTESNASRNLQPRRPVVALQRTPAALPSTEYFGISKTFRSLPWLSDKVIRASKQNDLDAILRLAPDARVTVTDRNGMTALHWAASLGHVEATTALLTRNSPVNSGDVHARTALLLATRGKHSDVVAVLLAAGAWVNVRDLSGDASIHAAAEGGAEEALWYLLQAGADTEARDGRGLTAIARAALSNKLGAVRMLVKCGANVDTRVPLASGKLTGLCEWATGDSNNKGTDSSKWTTLLWRAVRDEKRGLVRCLLDCGADVSIRGPAGLTPLHLTARQGDAFLSSLLLEYGADVNAVSTLGWTALHTAARKGHKSTCALLLRKGADKEKKTADGRTARSLAKGECGL